MLDQTPAFAYFLPPLALLWLGLAIAETAKVLAAIRADRNR